MKTLDETQRALECCFQYGCCIGCPYHNEQDKSSGACVKRMGTDALLHLIQLGAKIDILERLEDDLK